VAVESYRYKSLAKDMNDLASMLDIKVSIACGHDGKKREVLWVESHVDTLSFLS
jgi:hypothetical protein